MQPRHLAILAGASYLVIFFAAIYANFFVLDALLQDPLGTVEEQAVHVRFGVLAFLTAAVFDVVVAWALYELYKSNPLSALSTYFRVIHATLMGAAVFVLPPILALITREDILGQVHTFNTLWLIGLLFFGVHLILLGRILKHLKIISLLITLAGIMYIIDTCAHFLLPNYEAYADMLLMMVALPAVLGEMSLALWLLIRGGRRPVEAA